MNRINPLYATILLLVVLAIGMLKLSNSRDELKELEKVYKTTNRLSTELTALKDVYSDKGKVKESLQNILKQPVLRSALLKSDFKKSSVNISSEDMDINSLNLLMNKILNTSYNINSLDIKRISDEKVSFKMEIKW